nr:MAG TPA: helix-turn-helix domain protein [Caudoviricetes sp.]
MNERLKELRKSLKMNQAEFAKALGVGQSSLAMIETNRRPLTNKNIKLICAEFDVNEEWLRTGEGEMFVIRSDEEELAAFFGDILNDGSSFKKRFISALAALDTEDWEVIEKFINSIIAEKKERGEL